MAHILVIDDSEVIRSLLREYLSEIGHKVDIATDGRQGQTMALERDYDAVFCDVHMPRLNGYEVFRSVVAVKPTVRFVMTDSLPDELADKALEHGAHACLTKPFDLDQVGETMRQLLEETKKT
ncbi:MAG: response regulator [candidate division Zixibacteria bacterium]|nr:response regulator [candidate division Zixibacteria bacterium]